MKAKVLLICSSVLAMFLIFQNCGKKSGQDLTTTINSVDDTSVDDNSTKAHFILLWTDGEPARVVIFTKDASDAASVETLRLDLPLSATFSVDIKDAVFAKYLNFQPQVFDVVADQNSKAHFYMLSDDGKKLLAISLISEVMTIEWEIALLKESTNEGLASAEFTRDGNVANLQIDKNLLQNIYSTKPTIIEAATCTANQHVVSNVCIPNVRACMVNKITGQQTWTGTAWGDCLVVAPSPTPSPSPIIGLPPPATPKPSPSPVVGLPKPSPSPNPKPSPSPSPIVGLPPPATPKPSPSPVVGLPKPSPAPAPKPAPSPSPQPAPKPAPAPAPAPKPAPAPSPQPAPKPAPSPSPQPAPKPAPAPSPQPAPKPAPAPSPQPAPKPAPAPSPQPAPKPAPAPAPAPKPAPSPSPQPAPAPAPAPRPAPSPSPQPAPRPAPAPSPQPAPKPAPAPAPAPKPAPSPSPQPAPRPAPAPSPSPRR